MFRTLRARLRDFRRQRHGRRLDQTDAAALAAQAPPDATRVLLVRPDSIGDYLLFRPTLREMSRVSRSRGQHLTLLANALWGPLAQAWDADLFDELLPVDFPRFARELPYRAEVLHRVGQLGVGQVVHVAQVREPATENFIRFLRAPIRVASQTSPRPGAWFARLDAGYSHLLPVKPTTVFAYERNREFLTHWQAVEEKPGGVSISSFATDAPRSAPKSAATADAAGPALTSPTADAADHSVAAAAVWQLPATVAAGGATETAAGPYIVLFPGASARQKRWPAAHFAALARGLQQHYGRAFRLVLAGSPADAPLARRISRAAGPAVAFDDRTGHTDLLGLAALLAGARLLISNDTVAAHLAAQAGTPTLVLLMGENYGQFFPYPPGLLQAPCRCLFPPSQEARFAAGNFSAPARDPDLATITPARVLATALELVGM